MLKLFIVSGQVLGVCFHCVSLCSTFIVSGLVSGLDLGVCFHCVFIDKHTLRNCVVNKHTLKTYPQNTINTLFIVFSINTINSVFVVFSL